MCCNLPTPAITPFNARQVRVYTETVMDDRTTNQLRSARKQDNREYKKAHIQVLGNAERMQELTEWQNQKRVRMTTYSKAWGCEVGPSAFATLYAFFHNPDDANHVRVEPLVDF